MSDSRSSSSGSSNALALVQDTISIHSPETDSDFSYDSEELNIFHVDDRDYRAPASHAPHFDIAILRDDLDSATPFRGPPVMRPQRRFIVRNPELIPTELFVPQINKLRSTRYVNITNPFQALVYIDGSETRQSGQGQGHASSRASAGFGIVYRPDAPHENVSEPLDIDEPQDTHRAELKAVLYALQLREWNNEGFTSVVIATHSTFLYAGLVEHAWQWQRSGWIHHNRNGRGEVQVEDRDLWERVLVEILKLELVGVQPMFWCISRALNVADPFARLGAVKQQQQQPPPPPPQHQLHHHHHSVMLSNGAGHHGRLALPPAPRRARY